MMRSMTGFGTGEATLGNKKFSVRISSLNSKGLDLNIRMPFSYRAQEQQVRTHISKLLERGKIDLSVNIETSAEIPQQTINKSIAVAYARQLTALSDEMGIDKGDLLQIIMRLPDVISQPVNEISDDEMKSMHQAIDSAVTDLISFREMEGNVLLNDITANIKVIDDLLSQILPFEKARIDNQRVRIMKMFEEWAVDAKIDQNRFEQEMIFYIEKLDISEEKVRLKSHVDFFTQTISDIESPGKKLGFISQEIGREINTIGSKANDVVIQKIVIEMKDALEKIKEQLSNVL
jgi:uncharacterized protein (TIGR00255 family)